MSTNTQNDLLLNKLMEFYCKDDNLDNKYKESHFITNY